MHTIPTIPGVKLEVYKENQLVTPEADGYVGQLFSGDATILAVVDPTAEYTFAYLRDGQDHYTQVTDWIEYLNRDYGSLKQCLERQKRKRQFLAGRSFEAGTRVYGVTMPLRRVQENPFNTVHYPENTLALAQYLCNGGQLTGRVHVWEIALVSQNGEFFLTVHRHYNMAACRSAADGRICFPRLQAHRLLARLLAEKAPDGLPLTPGEDLIPLDRPAAPPGLGRTEGIVESWYFPRNMGTILTSQGPARVHWSDVPQRPHSRLRFLKEGERVRFAELIVPQRNPETEWRKVRKAQFKLEARGIEVASAG